MLLARFQFAESSTTGPVKKPVFLKRKTRQLLFPITLLALFFLLQSHLRYTNPLPATTITDSVPPPPPHPTAHPDGCAHFLHRMATPGSHFLTPQGPIFTPELTPTRSSSASNPAIPQHIYFLHYNTNLTNPKYLCSLESAARQNPLYRISVHVRNRDAFESRIQAWRSRMGDDMSSRILTQELDWKSVMMDTPLEPWYLEKVYEKSAWVDQNLGNAFRLANLYKNGGVYLDMDIVSLNPIREMGRGIAMQDSRRMNNAYLAFPKGDEFLRVLMERFVKDFKGYMWGHNGPELVTRTFNATCNPPHPNEICTGLHLSPTARFFPVKFGERAWLFDEWTQKCALLRDIADNSVGLHWWNKRTQGTLISNATTVAVILRNACPVVFEAFREEDLGIGSGGLVGETAYQKNEKLRPANMMDAKKRPVHLILTLTALIPRRVRLCHLLLAVTIATLLVLLLAFQLNLRAFAHTPDPSLLAAAEHIRSLTHLDPTADLASRNWSNLKCNHFIDRLLHPSTHHLPALPLASSASTPPDSIIPNEIFFLHYSPTLENPKYLCSLESAARQNPLHKITIHAANASHFSTSLHPWLQTLPASIRSRIQITPLDYATTFLNTPLAQWYTEKRYTNSKWPAQNLGNAFRLAQLWHRGGVYLDLDILSVNPVGQMGRGIVMQDANRMNNAYFSVEKGDAWMWVLMEEFVNSFNGNIW
ncbi:Lactosylceramide 4-alpha-galactosyltransferase [Podochytrium sp. JEL0797]|nr:Lactosylceramide 4-alpha-galactosyltransferase [Podochytrium sp. JEL0797]